MSEEQQDIHTEPTNNLNFNNELEGPIQMNILWHPPLLFFQPIDETPYRALHILGG